MKTETIDLYKYFGLYKPEGASGTLTSFIHYQAPENCIGRTRPAILVIPGGGYGMLSDREGEPIAIKYLSEGFNAFLLSYSVAPVRFPAQIIEAAMAMVYIRENVEKYNIKNDSVAAIGFSAGGHLTGMLATIYDCAEIKSALRGKCTLVRPDAVILSYPVISSRVKPHKGSFDNLCGQDGSLKKRLSLEFCVNKDTSPAFIWTTVDDDCVPSENALLMAKMYKDMGVEFELHMFQKGVHGLSLSNEETCLVNKPVQKWFELSVIWLKERGFVIKDKDF